VEHGTHTAAIVAAVVLMIVAAAAAVFLLVRIGDLRDDPQAPTTTVQIGPARPG
jgi:hypothetical protein